jgi:hypothetical protein
MLGTGSSTPRHISWYAIDLRGASLRMTPFWRELKTSGRHEKIEKVTGSRGRLSTSLRSHGAPGRGTTIHILVRSASGKEKCHSEKVTNPPNDTVPHLRRSILFGIHPALPGWADVWQSAPRASYPWRFGGVICLLSCRVQISCSYSIWCLQSDRTQRGFSSRKDALRCPVLFRSRSENALMNKK